MDLKQRMIETGLLFKFKKISKEIFEEWIINANKIYSIPRNLYSNKNDNIFDQFLNHFEKAITSLVKYDNKKSSPEWSLGYLCGFIQGSINLLWLNEYVIKYSKEYEIVIMLKVMHLYFYLGQVDVNTISYIYNYCMDYRVNDFELLEESIPNIVSISDYINQDRILNNKLNDNYIKYFSNELLVKYNKIMENYNDEFCPRIDDYIRLEDLQKIIPEEMHRNR